ncbi:hypothetical protein [Pseudonocardia nigra]|uniref:hypothetical protein n=1 Tax=Pseudonocardia nigra TaxID=1921578 RepID=UPI001C5E1BE9|nr:hypothetical protein [Pseudonocardia nigra]
MCVVVPLAVMLIAIGLQRLEAGLLPDRNRSTHHERSIRRRVRTRRAVQPRAGLALLSRAAKSSGSPYNRIHRFPARRRLVHGRG